MSLVCFDYDDTLFPSSFLNKKGYSLNNNMIWINEVDDELKEFETTVYKLLSTALSHSKVAIVSNSQSGWIQLSAEKFIPGILPLLNQCIIISARSMYENRYPDSPLKWKFYAFQDLLKDHRYVKNIVSFGDSYVEREAILTATQDFPHIKIKSIKFTEKPSVIQLLQEQELVTSYYKYIYNHENNLDLMLTTAI